MGIFFDCIGCGACSDICLRKAIKLAFVNEEYKNTFVDTFLCNCCGECVSVCPINCLKYKLTSDTWLRCTIEEDGGKSGGMEDNNDSGIYNGGGKWGDIPALPAKFNKLIFKNKNLNGAALQSLDRAFDEMLEVCSSSAIYNYLINNGYRFTSVSIDPSLLGNAGYNFSNASLTFRNASTIDGESLFHEMFHLFQQKHSNWGIESDGMMEYERTLFTDIMYYIQYGDNGDYRRSPWIDNGANGAVSKENRDWLKYITKNRKKVPTSIPNEDFSKWAEVFKTCSRAYMHKNFPSHYNSNAIIKALSLSQNCI